MFLLDVLPIDPTQRHERIRPVIRKWVEDSAGTVRDTIDATKEVIADSVAKSQLIIDEAVNGQSEASLLLPIVVAAVALCGCLYLARQYKRRMSEGNAA